MDFTLWEGGAELGGRQDNCREGDGGNSVAWQRKAIARGGLQAGKTSSGLVGAGPRAGRVEARSGPCGQAELASSPGPAVCELCDPRKRLHFFEP